MYRKAFVFALLILTSLIFIGRLFYIQIIDKSLKLESDKNARQKEIQYPDRGYIYDRNGVLIVSNQPAYDLMVIPKNVKNIDTLEFCKLVNISKQTYIDKIKKAKKHSMRKASLFLKKLSKEEYAFFQEKMFKFPGFYIQKKTLRLYPFKNAANVFGYVGEVSKSMIKNDLSNHYKQGDQIGISGIEKSYENELRGKRGIKYYVVDVHNKIQGTFRNKELDTLAINGNDVTATIDINLQLLGESLMANKRGGIVAIEPRTGEILALVTSPNYDPSLMLGRKRAEFSLSNARGRPLFDRSLLAQYPPGSPFKLITGLIGLQERIITPNSKFICRHGFHYGKLHVKCHCGYYDKPQKLHSAILRSCNNFFIEVYKASIENEATIEEGLDKWSNHVKSFGLGNYLNNDLSVGKKGLVPSVDMYNKIYGKGRWRSTFTLSNAIGQGELLVTPIQLANMTAAIANHGYYYTPHIVRSVENMPKVKTKYIERKYTTIEPKYFKPIINGMVDVFESPRGTARFSKIKGILLAGKTGTAENPHGEDHSIFIAFGPVENPKIAVAVFVESGYWGSRWAAPIATLMIEKYLKGEISRKELQKKMETGSLQEEYIKQESVEQK